LKVGEISTVVPEYLQKCYPAAVDKSELLHDTELKIEIVPANCICHNCSQVFSLIKNKNICPDCGCSDTEIISGRDLLIKEIEGC
jgi:hydrogenase nickel incorporation protein HypA/HybF